MLLCTRLDCFHSSFGPLVLLTLDTKGGERVDLGGVVREVLVSLCATFMHYVYIPALAFCVMCACEILE
jgi:hypothetical protein